jgi:hypothetical protein
MAYQMSNQEAMALLMGDRLSEEYLSERFSRLEKPLPAISYEITGDSALLHQYYLLRDTGRDAFDGASEVAAARMGRQCIAACRMTFSKESRTPCEKQFGLIEAMPELVRETYIEISNPVILPDFQDDIVMVELIRMLLQRGAELGARFAVTISPVPLARSCRKAAELFGLSWDIHNDEVSSGNYEANLALYTLDLSRVSNPELKAQKAGKEALLSA